MAQRAAVEGSSEDRVSLADYLSVVLRGLRPLPPLDVDLTQAYGNVLADNVVSPGPLPAFDHAAIDGYACRYEDLGVPAHRPSETPARPARLSVVGAVSASSWQPARLAPGSCFAIAAGAPMPGAADVVVPVDWTDEGMVTVTILRNPKRGHGIRRTGEEIAAGAVLAKAGSLVNPALVSVLASVGVGHVAVRPSPRVMLVATGDELVDAGRASQPGQVVDSNSHALTAAAVDAGADAYRLGICDDDPEVLRGLLEDQSLRCDLIITTGGTGTGPNDLVRRVFSRQHARSGQHVTFTDLAVYPCTTLGYGAVAEGIPIVCLPGDPGAALIGFEVLARPVIQLLAGIDPVFRPSVRAHLLETVNSPAGLREFRPATVAERRGGGYTVAPLPGGPYTLSGLIEANGLLVLGEKVTTAAAGLTVDVLLLDRRR
jgi:molybdopterin molybdotransferase